MSRVGVTGAAGHVGSNLCRALLKRGYQVRALVSSDNSDTQPLEGLDIEIVKGNVLSEDDMLAFTKDCEYVIHTAAIITISGDPTGIVYKTNVEGPRNVAACCLKNGAKRLVHFSSIHAFVQHPLNEVLDEERAFVGPDGFVYDRSKVGGTKEILKAVENGLDAVIVHPTSVVGPVHFKPALMNRAILDMYEGKLPALVPGGYNFVDVRDVADGAIAAMEKGRKGERYLLAGEYQSMKDLSKLLGEVSGRKTVQRITPMWVAKMGLPFIQLWSKISGNDPLYTRESLYIVENCNFKMSNEKARKELGFNPRPLRQTLAELVQWVEAGKPTYSEA